MCLHIGREYASTREAHYDLYLFVNLDVSSRFSGLV